VRALINTAAQTGLPLRILEAVEAVNNIQKGILAQKIVARFGERLVNRRIAVWGLAFKPNTDDMREAPSQALIRELLDRGATVCAYDPVAMPEARRVFRKAVGLQFSDSPLEALDGADALAIVTEWKEFRSPDFATIRHKLKSPVIFDGRNLYEPEDVKRNGLEYHCIGRRA
jgi:UDPglucose 6-dehydrogenase